MSGHAPPADQTRLIDLEALVLATTSLGRQDPRLFDEAFDWLASFGSVNNLQRLANLHRIHPLSDSRVLIAIADWLVKKASQPRWKAIAKGEQIGNELPLETLFHSAQGQVLKISDEIFQARGLARSVFQPRGLKRAFQPLLASNLTPALPATVRARCRRYSKKCSFPAIC